MKDPLDSGMEEMFQDEQTEVGIIPSAVADKIRKDANERQRKARARSKATNEKLRAKKAAENEVPDKFWAKNREIAGEAVIAPLLERQEMVFAHLTAMEAAMTGSVDAELLYPSEVDADAKADVKEHGECGIETALLEFWKDPGAYRMLLAHPKTNAATKNFARFGILTGIPSHRLNTWREWVESKRALQPTRPSNGYTTIQCANPECKSQPVSVAQEIFDGYQRLGKSYFCHNCLSDGSRSAAQASPFYRKAIKAPEDEIHDAYGRVKGQ